MQTSIILKAITGGQKGREFLCGDQAQVILGRSRSCHIQIPEDPMVSRHHCLVEIDGFQVRVHDLGSKNGTYVNRELIGQRQGPEASDSTFRDPRPHTLRSGDELRLGHNVFLVEIVERSEVGSPGVCLAYA